MAVKNRLIGEVTGHPVHQSANLRRGPAILLRAMSHTKAVGDLLIGSYEDKPFVCRACSSAEIIWPEEMFKARVIRFRHPASVRRLKREMITQSRSIAHHLQSSRVFLFKAEGWKNTCFHVDRGTGFRGQLAG